MRTNAIVKTPLGRGIVQGRWSATEWLVRLPIDDLTKTVLGVSITPRAKHSGLWVFEESELK